MNYSSSTFNTYQNKLKEQRKNPETSRAGLKWEQDEDNTLLDKLKDDVSIEDIAKELQRTVRSIKTRLIIKALTDMRKNSSTIEEASVKYKITVDDINNYISSKKNRTYPNKQQSYNTNAIVTLSSIYSLLLEIKDKLH